MHARVGWMLWLGALGCSLNDPDAGDGSNGTADDQADSSGEDASGTGEGNGQSEDRGDASGEDRGSGDESGDESEDESEDVGEDSSGDGSTGTETDEGGSDDGTSGDSGSDSGADGTDTGSGTSDGEETGGEDSGTDEGSDSGDDGGSHELRLDHMQVKGSHNSYHVAPAVPLHASHRYTHAPLDVQLEEQGVRAFELDLHLESDGFHVYHLAVIDPDSTCDRLEDCLSTLKGWSDEHPDHVPIIVWFEIKDENGGMTIDDLGPVDEVLTGLLPNERLFTPDDLAGSYESPRARIEAEGWPIIDAVRGQFIFVVLDSGGVAEDYSDGYTSLEGRAMFVRASEGQFQEPWAVFSKIDDPGSAAIAEAHAAGVITASNTCSADASDSDCEADLAAALQTGTHMVKDDFPAPADDRDYWLDFVDGNPVRCNDVTAPAGCTAADLESL